MEPLPALIIVIDEFTQMFLESPDSKKLIDEIGRQGRALNVKMIMGSQRLGHEMNTGIMTNIPIRVGLRTWMWGSLSPSSEAMKPRAPS